MYETEFKVELSAKEKDALVATFKEKGFAPAGVSQQRDFYVKAEPSPLGGYDIERYRDEDGELFYTKKTWEKIGDTMARKEEEKKVSQADFDAATQSPKILIRKKREWFDGKKGETEISLTIDTVKFDHSPTERYFTEGEIGVEDKGKVKETKELIKAFMAELIGREAKESPGMFTMAYEKR